MMHWLAHILGLDSVSGMPYAFWSGFGSDLGIFGAVLALYWRHVCHKPKCWRIGRHVVAGTPWCNRHHRAAGEA